MAEATGFLYPFLDASAEDTQALLDDLSRSAAAKWRESVELRERSLAELHTAIATVAAAIADRVRAGGRVFAVGNGGSATDAAAFVRLAVSATPRSLPAVSLAGEPAVLTALANDIGVEAVFARQLGAHARRGDVVVAFSTSGGSSNIVAALDHARAAGILTVAIAGYGGGAMRAHAEHCLPVSSESVHRIQEAQAAIAEALVHAISASLDDAAEGDEGTAP